MNYIINKLLRIIYILKSKLLHYQEKLCYKMVVKYCKTNPIFKNVEMNVYSEITYYEGRDCTILFCFKNVKEEERDSIDYVFFIYLRDKLLKYGFNYMIQKIKDINSNDDNLKLIYSI